MKAKGVDQFSLRHLCVIQNVWSICSVDVVCVGVPWHQIPIECYDDHWRIVQFGHHFFAHSRMVRYSDTVDL